MTVKTLLNGATTTTTGAAFALDGVNSTFQAVGRTTSSTGACAVSIEVSNDSNSDAWVVAGTMGLTLGTTDTSDGFMMFASWPFARVVVNSISGTGASVDVTVGK